MNDNFYRIFEERHRGSRNLIKERLQVYLPFVQPLLDVYPEGCAIDLGCGRGEWLELLKEAGFNPVGVDLSEDMLEACQSLSLSVVQADALELLANTETSSQLVVSAFHLVEHVSFEDLRAIVTESLRVLKPGGFLIMETPNPENIAVATNSFYLDPTHKRPIPKELLFFVAEFAGFERVKTLRLQESKEILSFEKIGLTQLINCVSPDYAIVAQKAADASILSQSQDLFASNFGISLDELSIRHDQMLTGMESRSVQAVELAQQALQFAQQALQFAQQAEARAQQAEAKAQQAEILSLKFGEQLLPDQNKPLRLIKNLLSWLCIFNLRRIKSGIKTLIKKFLRHLVCYVMARPVLKRWVKWLAYHLGFTYFIKRYVIESSRPHPFTLLQENNFSTSTNLKTLSPRARQIYSDLKATITEHSEGEQ